MATAEESRPGMRKPDGIWERPFSYHPFTPVLDRAEGVYLYDEDGNRYMDASGGPMAVNLGHGDRRIIEAITKQAEKFSYVHPILSNRPRAELCEKISERAPGTLNTTFLASGGSEAIETAIKLAHQYHSAKGNPQKNIVISRWESYHGMSLGALSVAGGPTNRHQFNNMLFAWPPHSPTQYSDPTPGPALRTTLSSAPGSWRRRYITRAPRTWPPSLPCPWARAKTTASSLPLSTGTPSERSATNTTYC